MLLTELTIAEARKMLQQHVFSATELVQEHIELIQKLDPSLGAFLTITEEQALNKAKEIDSKKDYTKPLSGIPIGIKDIICTRHVKTTCASHILDNFIPPYNATVFNRIEQAGGIMIGKTNMDEFAMGSSTENSAYYPTKNPWDLTQVPGGSSGGSAAAVAAHMCMTSLGTDTGGSIRQPAALCGVVGVKPTYGRVSRFGVLAMASSLDQVGPFTKTVEDAAILMEVLAGEDLYDATTLPAPVPPYHQKLNPNIKGIRIGIPREYFEDGLDIEDRKVIEQAIKQLQHLGAIIQEISLPHTKYALAVYYLVMPSEVSANLARYDGIRYGNAPSKEDIHTLDDIYLKTKSKGFGPEPKRRIMLGTFALSAGYQDKFYLQAQKVRTLIKQDFDQAFQQVDAIVTPTSPSTAWKLGEKMDDPLKMYLSDIYTIPANLAGICGLSMPIGFSHHLPVGLQILGNQLQEQTILNIGYALDTEIQFYKHKPPLLSQES
jgi:aspartyl-tRNA(Asn)/glutamyl-tRNA(Gln) amidotransferase subunit A